jgi:restriction endonuclease Mrr
MSIPSSQVIMGWVKDTLQGEEWVLLNDLCILAIKTKWSKVSETQLYEVVDSNLSYVAEHLRNEAAEWRIDGTSPTFEIDDDPSPYIRSVETGSRATLQKLRRISPAAFESVCARILRQLGALDAQTTQLTNDGGVDFHAVQINIVPSSLSVPVGCKAAAIGQAKRYKDGNLIRETQVREFVGAAVLKRYELQQESVLRQFSPVLLAFWTTSDFDPNARKYARALGLWHMDGRTLADYVKHLGLEEEVLAMPDHNLLPTNMPSQDP